jgi:serine/threonine-protein kinase
MIGTVIGRTYQLLHELSRDERGATYLALVLATNEVVDLRFVSFGPAADDAEARRRFQREVTLLGGLHDPHVVRLYRHGQHQGAPYLVFEHLPGITLHTILETLRAQHTQAINHLSEEQALRIARQMAAGLAYGHSQQVLHRALSPQAILVSNEGLVKIVDYRLAKAAHSAEITLPGSPAAAPSPYTAPEQLQGQDEPASDLYALGAILYEMLTGVAPAPPATLQSQPNRDTTGLRPPSALVPSLTPAVSELAMRCLATEPAARPASAEALVSACARLLPTAKTDSGPFGAGGDSALADLVEHVGALRRLRTFRAAPSAATGPRPDEPPQASPALGQGARAWVERDDGSVVRLTKSVIRVGRQDRAQGIAPDITFAAKWVHRRYLRLEFRGDTWHVLEEAGVTHGACLNGVRLHPDEARRLADGDVITLGSGACSVSMTFHCN